LWVLFGGGPPPALDSKNLIVTRSGRENTFPTVLAAVKRARPGDHIIVEDEVWEEEFPPLNSVKNVTLQAEDGKMVEWRIPDLKHEPKQFVVLSNVEGWLIQGFSFDGRNRVEDVILLTGSCAGVTVRNVEVQGFRKRGINVVNCAGRSMQPVTLQHLTIRTKDEKEAGIALDTVKIVPDPRNEHILVKDCRFEGPFKTKVLLVDPARNQYVEVDPSLLPPRVKSEKPAPKTSK
jgi:hypothetical protein